MTTLVICSSLPLPTSLLPRTRRFVRWLTKPHVVLALIMLVVMFVMVIIPLYKLVETTVTWQDTDINRCPGRRGGRVDHLPLGQDADRRLRQDLHLHPPAAFDDHRHSARSCFRS